MVQFLPIVVNDLVWTINNMVTLSTFKFVSNFHTTA